MDPPDLMGVQRRPRPSPQLCDRRKTVNKSCKSCHITYLGVVRTNAKFTFTLQSSFQLAIDQAQTTNSVVI